MMNRLLSCRCGQLRGTVANAESATRAICYCRDCQSFAHYLGRPADVLDARGGTDIIAIHPRQLSFTLGIDQLACMSLSERGLLRWYARCCHTAIGNTTRDFKVAHVGLVHTCLHDATQALDPAFGPVRMVVNTKSAKGRPPTMALSTVVCIGRFMLALTRRRLDGSYRQTPLFDAASGAPIRQPAVIDRDERARLRAAVS